MTIDSGWVAALATLVSALILTVTAVIAVRRLRHDRNANDIVVYLRLIDERFVAFGPHTGRAFEHLAMRAKRYIASGRMAREADAPESDPARSRRGVADRATTPAIVRSPARSARPSRTRPVRRSRHGISSARVPARS